jgi:acyl-CoA synthetase (AMP-forming)/AMP-acid ligase II
VVRIARFAGALRASGVKTDDRVAMVENALAGHPGVAASAVIGIPDERWGECVHAVI